MLKATDRQGRIFSDNILKSQMVGSFIHISAYLLKYGVILGESQSIFYHIFLQNEEVIDEPFKNKAESSTD